MQQMKVTVPDHVYRYFIELKKLSGISLSVLVSDVLEVHIQSEKNSIANMLREINSLNNKSENTNNKA